MARAYGSRAQMALAFESVYGTAPVSGYLKVPFAQQTLRHMQDMTDSELLGFGRDPLDPTFEGLRVQGEVVVPVDTVAIGHWLKAIFGVPDTTGAGPYTHFFKSGGTSQPSMAIEMGYPEVPNFEMYTGLRADGFRITGARQGQLQMRIPLVGRGYADANGTAAGTPVETYGERFNGFNGQIDRDGVALGNVTSCELSFSNGLETIDTLRDDGLIEGVDPGMCRLDATVTARFADMTLVNQAINRQVCQLELTHLISPSARLTLRAERLFLARPDKPVNGPGGIQATFAGKGARDTSPLRMFTAVLVNSTASYA